MYRKYISGLILTLFVHLGQKIRAARRKRKQNRRLEQERRREWRKQHRDKETGDYDEYGLESKIMKS